MESPKPLDILKIAFLSLLMLAPLMAVAGDLDGIEYFISIAVFLLVLSLICWFIVLIGSLKYLRGHEPSWGRFTLSGIVIGAIGLLILWLYEGKPQVQILGSLFFFTPLLVYAIVSQTKRAKDSEENDLS